MFDCYNRNITYLRISVTDRCNLRCTYCMPGEGVTHLDHRAILSFDEIVAFVEVAVSLGITKVRLTGGEPLVRRGIVDLTRMIAAVPGINDLSMTTNGTLLGQFAQPLWDAGLRRINVSLDTINPNRFRELTRGGDIESVFTGLRVARAIGFSPIKINCVVSLSSNEPDAIGVKEYSERMGFEVRFIPQMNLDSGSFGVVQGGDGGNCRSCNRIRLTANGFVKPCLFNDIGFNVRELGAREAIFRAIGAKPERGTQNHSGDFYNIGG